MTAQDISAAALAATEQSGQAQTQRDEIMALFNFNCGWTNYEIHLRTGIREHVVSAHLGALQHDGTIMESGATRPGGHGAEQVVWRLGDGRGKFAARAALVRDLLVAAREIRNGGHVPDWRLLEAAAASIKHPRSEINTKDWIPE